MLDFLKKELSSIEFAEKTEKQILERNSLSYLRLLLTSLKGSLWEHPPVSPRTFIEHPYYLNLKGHVHDWIIDAMEKIYVGYDKGVARKYHTVVVDGAIGTGKTFFSSIFLTYFAYLLLCLKNPQLTFELAPNSVIALGCASSSGRTSKGTIFQHVWNRISYCRWFRENYPPHPDFESVIKLDEPRSKKDIDLNRNYKRIWILPSNSSEFSNDSFDLICFVIDEATKFKKTESRDQVKNVFDMNYIRIWNRFKDSRAGMIALVGSTESDDAFLEKKFEEGKTNPEVISFNPSIIEVKYKDYKGKFFYVSLDTLSLYETYDELPTISKTTRNYVKIPDVPSLRKPFETDVEECLKNLCAIRVRKKDKFFRDVKVLRHLFNYDREIPIESNDIFDEEVKLELLKPKKDTLYFIHIDPASTIDRLGFCMGHLKGYKNTPQGVLPEIYIDLIFSKKGRRGEPIDLKRIEDLIKQLEKNGFHIELISCDRYQSEYFMRNLEKAGFFTELLSVDTDLNPYLTLKTLIFNKCIDIYFHPLLFKELKELRYKGKRVDHPKGGSKDLADALAGCCHHLYQEFLDYRENNSVSIS